MEANGHYLEAEVIPFTSDARETVSDREKALFAELERERARNARLQALVVEKEKSRTLTLKVSEKGGISVYGLGRFPVTLYPEQWEKIGPLIPLIAEFVEANSDEIFARQAAAKAAKQEK